ncbi:hypothetical protein [Prosthecobacter sp.]|uniref:hypothetical protein n=1 Tax=Prosthecobacter sp. TaxID=1965333 RepID=UPI003783A9BD
MKSNPSFLRIIFLLATFASGLQGQSFAAEKSKYFGAKLIELDSLIDQSKRNNVQFMVTDSLKIMGRVVINRIRTPMTAVDFANAKAKFFAEEGTLISKPTSGWFATNDSTYEAVTGSNDTKIHIYTRVMKSDLECYWIIGTMSEGNWKTNGEALRTLIDSFKFN